MEETNIQNVNFSFEDLTPSHNVDLGPYKKALDEAFSNKRIKNIAISGTYGAGKSSLIETYKKSSNLNFIHISLTHFETEKNSPNENIINNLEGKIINQLIQQIDSKNIPQTRFKIKEDVSIMQTIIISMLTLIILLFLIINYKYDNWIDLINKFALEWNCSFILSLTSQTFQFFTFLCIFLIMAYLIYNIVYIQKNKHFIKRATAKDFEIEIFEDSNESYFDKYLNEVLYIFKKSEKDVFIFEDMDRYNDNYIFEKLREINTLVNNKVKDKTIKFVYLLKDDTFVSKDRTKFFDFIIPVIPVVDSTNSYDKLIERFSKANILDLFNQDFLSDISLYIDEYRILKNICNEYMIYHTKLNNIQLDYNKLFAIIVYKNIFPKDFSELQLNYGYVKSLFDSKSTLIRQTENNINEHIKSLKQELKNIEHILENSIDELDSTYIILPDEIRVNSYTRSHFKNRVVLIKEIKKANYVIEEYQSNFYSSGYQNKNIKNLFDNLMNIPEYKKKYNILIKGKEKEISSINKEINQLEIKKLKIRRRNLKDLINRETKDKIFDIELINEKGIDLYEYIKSSNYFNLLKFLISNGYIDENTYSDYMSYFYPNSISQNDKIFLRSLTDQKSLEYDYSLNSPIKIFKRINEKYFYEQEILNYNLLSYLLFEDKKDKIQVINSLLTTNNYLEFITNYFFTYKNIDFFCKYFLNNNIILLDIIDDTNNINYDYNKIIIYSLFFNNFDMEPALIEYINAHDCLLSNSKIEFIKETFKEDINNIFDERIEKRITIDISDNLVSKLIENGIKFNCIDFSKVDQKLLTKVYENNCYAITVQNINSILEHFYKICFSDNYYTQNSTLIFSNKEQPLYNYILNNINEYIEQLLCNINNEINDSEDVVIFLLNNEQLSIDLKKRYIGTLNTKINDISTIQDTNLWDDLIISHSIISNEDNILKYYVKNNSLNEISINFINSIDNLLIFNLNKIANEYGENIKNKLFNELVKCNNLNNNQYNSIFKNCNINYLEFSFKNINKDKINILIDNSIICMNIETLNYIRNTYPANLYYYIDKFSNEYINIMSKDEFEYDELIHILSSTNFTDNQKISLMKFSNDSISYRIEYSSLVKEHILNNCFDKNDYQLLSNNYENECNKIRDTIENIFNKDIEFVISSNMPLNNCLLFNLLEKHNLEENNKLSLINNSLNEINDFKKIKRCFQTIKAERFIDIFYNKNPLISINKINQSILSKLENKKIISSYKIDNKKDEYYRVYSKHK